MGWKEDETDLFKSIYPFMASADIAEIFGKSESAVNHKAMRLGIVKDEGTLYLLRSMASRGESSGNFKGYRRVSSKGYVMLYMPDNPMASAGGLVMEHRLVMANHIGRPLNEDEDVHHKNGKKKDNRIENLLLLMHAEHTALHNRMRKRRKKAA